jgi:biopolymer transport protein ExbD
MNNAGAAWTGWGRPFDACALGAMGAALALLTLALLLVPQRLAQRPASQGIVSLRLARDGQLRLWNQSIQAGPLITVLRGMDATVGRPTVRLIPDADVPWGSVQRLVGQLNRTGLPLELQLP